MTLSSTRRDHMRVCARFGGGPVQCLRRMQIFEVFGDRDRLRQGTAVITTQCRRLSGRIDREESRPAILAGKDLNRDGRNLQPLFELGASAGSAARDSLHRRSTWVRLQSGIPRQHVRYAR